MKNEVLKCVIPLAEYPVYCCIGWDIEDFKQYMLKEHTKEILFNNFSYDGLCLNFGSYSIIYTESKIKLSVIVHEVCHAVDFALEYTEMFPENASAGEVRARATESLFNGIMDGLK